MREIKKRLFEKYSVSREISKVYEGEKLVGLNSTVVIRMQKEDPEGESRTVPADSSDVPTLARLILSLLSALCFHILNKMNKK